MNKRTEFARVLLFMFLIVGLGPQRLVRADEQPAADRAVRDDSAAEALGWKLGVQAYTFRRLTFFETVDRAARLGLKYMEAWPGQRLSPEHPNARLNPSLPPELRVLVKQKLEEAGVRVMAIGVTGATPAMMAFAQDMGIEVITTETQPTPELDRLAETHGVRLALHNHPRTWPPDQVLEATQDLSPRIGACADTGHWVRRGLDPVESIKKLEGRLISFHFKDLDEDRRDVPWGTGVANVRGKLEELHRQGFTGLIAIEYERGSVDELMVNLPTCIAFFDEVARELAKKDR